MSSSADNGTAESPHDSFPEPWRAYLRDNVFSYRLLSPAEQARLRRVVRVLVAGKFWEGCAGFEVTDEARVTVAGQAALLLLGRENYYFDELKTILIYPGGFLAGRDDGLDAEESVSHRLGEAHCGGPVVLSWWDVLWDGRRLGTRNLVLHEFAHKLAESGDADAGLPPLPGPELAARWDEVFGAAYQRLVEDVEYERPTLLDPYGATDRAEFFAVATECFFLRPAELRRRHADLYELLAGWYRQDPASRPWDDALAAQAKGAEEDYARHVVAECTAALRLRPDYLDAYRDRASWLASLGEYDQALADCTEVIRRAAKHERADAYYERGAVYLEREAYAEAVADFGEALRRAPDFARAYVARGVALAEQGEQGRARADLTRALRLDPKDDGAYLERARVYADEEKYDKALRDLAEAIRLAPHVAPAYAERAAVYLALAKHDEALADCDAAIRLDPEDAEAYRVRADVHEAKGDSESARLDRARAGGGA